MTVLTKEDLEEFKKELLRELKILLCAHLGKPHTRWLKTQEVTDLLKIGKGALQTLRINGTLSYTKLGGTLFYDANEIEELMQKNKIKNTF